MKLVVLGGGPAGYIAALRAAQLGAQAVLIEAREVGGTCLNRGCIPTKSMIASVERLRLAREAASFGVEVGEARVDFAALMRRKDEVVAHERAGVEHLLKARKVEIVAGRGRLVGPRRVRVEPVSRAGKVDGGGPVGGAPGGAAGEPLEVEGDALVLASGSEPMRLPMFDFSDPRVYTSDRILEIDHVPESLLVVGGGVIGCEFASLFAGLGTRVTVVEMLEQLLPGEDKRTGQALRQAFKKAGIEIRLKTRVEEVLSSDERGITVRLSDSEELTAALALVSVGRRAVSEGLGYEDVGVRLDRCFVVADETLRTSVEGVFAAGDLAGPPLLAHWAYHQGALAAENAVTGSGLTVDRRVVPSCVYCHPEVASCGITEDRAAAQGIEVDVAHFRFNANSKAVIEGEGDGYVRIVTERGPGTVLGASMVGPRVTDLIHEIALAATARLTLADIMATIHAHPTLAEAIGEAALSGGGRPLHGL